MIRELLLQNFNDTGNHSPATYNQIPQVQADGFCDEEQGFPTDDQRAEILNEISSRQP